MDSFLFRNKLLSVNFIQNLKLTYFAIPTTKIFIFLYDIINEFLRFKTLKSP